MDFFCNTDEICRQVVDDENKISISVKGVVNSFLWWGDVGLTIEKGPEGFRASILRRAVIASMMNGCLKAVPGPMHIGHAATVRMQTCTYC